MKVKSKLKKLLDRDGYVRIRNVLNFSKDLKPVLNDMEFVMDCLIRKYAPKTKKDKISDRSKIVISDHKLRQYVIENPFPRFEQKRTIFLTEKF